MRRLKIALLSRWYWEQHHVHGPEEGGLIQQLAEAVAALGHEVIVLTQSPEVRALKKIQIGALETWVSPMLKKRDLITGLRDKWVSRTYGHSKIFSDVLALGDFLKKRGPFDALWAQTEGPDGLVAGVAAKMKVRLPPLLVQIQNLPHHFVRGAPVFDGKSPLGIGFRRAARILANSELLANSLTSYVGPGLSLEQLQAKVRVAPPNLQRSFFQAAQDSASWPEPMTDRVLFLGAINRAKGALVFLDAIGQSEAAQRNSNFVIIGDFTEQNKRFAKRWEAQTEATRVRLSGARTEYLGKVSTFEVIRQIKLAKVVVVPSLFDGYPRALLEALALGRPVITTDRVGSAPLVEEHKCGIVVPPGDPEALAHAIDRTLHPRAPYAANAQNLIPQMQVDYSPETVAIHIAYHLDRIVAHKD